MNGAANGGTGGSSPDEGSTGGGSGRRGAAAAKWNARYAFSRDTVPPPAEVLSREARWLPSGEGDETGAGAAGDKGGEGRLAALDLACGRAGNGEWLAARGFEVCAWDVSERVIEALRARPGSGIRTAEVRDVLARPPAPDSFHVIVVARFLERALCPAIARALRPGGVLFYQTFTAGLANPDYLLGPNELLALFPDLTICSYHEPRAAPVASGARRARAEAMLVARRTG